MAGRAAVLRITTSGQPDLGDRGRLDPIRPQLPRPRSHAEVREILNPCLSILRTSQEHSISCQRFSAETTECSVASTDSAVFGGSGALAAMLMRLLIK